MCRKSDKTEHSTCLRASLIDSFVAFMEKEELKDNIMYLAKAEVFRKVGLDSELTPIQHDYCMFIRESETVTSETFMECVRNALQWTVLNTKHNASKQPPNYLQDLVCDVTELEISYQSESQYYEVACNQVEAKGPPELKKNIPKMKKDCSKVVGCIGKLLKHDSVTDEHISKKLKSNFPSVLFCCLNLDSLTQIRYDIPDQRVLWSENPSFLSQFKDLHFSEIKQFKPLSLFPPLWRHDVSLWENIGEDFDVQRFCDIVQDVTQGIVKCVLCMNVWAEPQEGRISRCYRLLYQSDDVAISHVRAHAFQNAVRLTVAKEMGVELR